MPQTILAERSAVTRPGETSLPAPREVRQTLGSSSSTGQRVASFDAPGWSNQAPAIFGQAFAQQQRLDQTKWREINMMPMMLEPTRDPVWPEDEEREDQEARTAGGKIPKLASQSLAERTAWELRVALPDRILGCILMLPRNELLPTGAHNYYVLYVPTTFLAAPKITPHRLSLRLRLEDAKNSDPPLVPVACYLYPGSQVATKITNLGEFEIDLGKAAVMAIKTVWPAMPDVVTARTGGSIDIRTVQARIQAAGLNSHVCEWRIADTELAYGFNPACVVQVPSGAQLAVRASLHVEVRQKIARVFYKSYFKMATPMRYVMSTPDDRPTRRPRNAAKVTLRRLGTVYASERGLFSYLAGPGMTDGRALPPGSSAKRRFLGIRRGKES
jgi:hypothetical protein